MTRLSELRQEVRNLIEQYPDERIVRFEFDQKVYWLKNFAIHERKDFLKAGTRRAMLREIRMLRKFNSLGVPVPPIILASGHHLVLGDIGTTLNRILPESSGEERTALLKLAAQALATLHQQDLVHGRPALRDLAYDGENIYFLDFESASFGRNLATAKAWDLFAFINSIFRERYLGMKEARRALLDYMATNANASATARYWRKTFNKYRLLRPIIRYGPFKGKDITAILGVFHLLYDEKNIWPKK